MANLTSTLLPAPVTLSRARRDHIAMGPFEYAVLGIQVSFTSRLPLVFAPLYLTQGHTSLHKIAVLPFEYAVLGIRVRSLLRFPLPFACLYLTQVLMFLHHQQFAHTLGGAIIDCHTSAATARRTVRWLWLLSLIIFCALSGLRPESFIWPAAVYSVVLWLLLEQGIPAPVRASDGTTLVTVE